MGYRQIRADFDRETVVVYQAYNEAIAKAAVGAQKFVPPFSYNRMTWIKPSFLWMMERCGWASKSNQERVLSVRMTRAGWEEALGAAVMTSPGEEGAESWKEALKNSPVRVQWDPERSLRGGKLEHRSIQVGISRDWSERYATEWVQSIEDITPLVVKIRDLRRAGRWDAARKLLPPEKVYPLPSEIAGRLRMEA